MNVKNITSNDDYEMTNRVHNRNLSIFKEIMLKEVGRIGRLKKDAISLRNVCDCTYC